MFKAVTETQYFELEIPLEAGEISNIFYYHTIDQEKFWKMSDKPLRVFRDGEIVADFSKWSDIVNNTITKNVIDKNRDSYTWFPTFIMYKNNLFRLYNKRFAQTHQGIIAVVDINGKIISSKSEERAGTLEEFFI